jgi:hypothetical protein
MPAAAPALDDGGALDERELTGVVSAALGRPVRLDGFTTSAVPYEPGSPATGVLLRVAGTTADGQPWSVFLKVLQHPRHWPRLGLLPEEVRQLFLASFPWRGELVAWEPGFADRLPPAGLRVPRLYRLTELGDDRLAVWMEDVATLDGAWDQARFARAARVLGGLAARRSDPALLAASGFPAGAGLRYYSSSRVETSGLPLLDQDELWSHPLVAGAADARLRADLRTLGGRVPELLDRMDDLPQALPHGDASPQNLLVPADNRTASWPSTCRSRPPRPSASPCPGSMPYSSRPSSRAWPPAASRPRPGRCISATWPAWLSGPASLLCRSSGSASRPRRPWPRPSVSGPPSPASSPTWACRCPSA